LASKIKFIPSNTLITIDESQSASLVIMFNKPTELETQIDWSIVGGDLEFQASYGSLILNAGESSASFSIQALMDNQREIPEQYQLYIGSPNSHVEGSLSIPVIINNITSSADMRVVEGPNTDFGSVAVSDKKSKLLTLENNGQAQASLSTTPALPLPYGFLGGSFPGLGGTCTLQIDGHSSCTIVISYEPIESGPRSELLTLNYFDGIDTHPLDLALAGSAVDINAVILGAPVGRNNVTTLNTTIAGADISQYKYKLGLASTTDCSITNGYSEPLAISSPITDSISLISDGLIRLCVVGKNQGNLWQAISVATVTDWTKDTTAPTISGLSDNLSWAQTRDLSWTCTGDDLCHFRFLVDQNTSTDLSSLSYDVINTTSIMGGNGTYYLHVQAKDSIGYESPTMSFQYQIDNTAPTTPGLPSDGDFKSNLNLSPTISWTAATDTLSSVVDYEIAIGSGLGLTDVQNWTSIGSTNLSASVSGLNLTSDMFYFASIRAVDGAGNRSAPATADGWLVDATNPVPPVLVNDGFISSSITTATLLWSAGSDGQSGISSYQVAVGTTPSGNDILDWTDVGMSLTTVQNVTLTQGGTYYGSVRVIDNAGNISTARSGDGWIATGQFVAGNRIADTSSPPWCVSRAKAIFMDSPLLSRRMDKPPS
jgi:hypothetical protein